MVSLRNNNQILALTVESRTIFFKFDSETTKVVECDRNIEFPSGKDIHNDDDDNSRNSVSFSSSDISKCGKCFAFVYGKCLSLWSLLNIELISNRSLQKRAVKVKFSPSSDSIVVADKAGDVYLFSVTNPSNPGILILGHLSMLLDVIISSDEKFIITCDRDEKIRVSLYPNAYNIHSYCLKHEEFVTNLEFLPHCQDILISTSGDGTVKLWDYKNGQLIRSLSYSYLPSAKDDASINQSNNAIVISSSAQLSTNESLICMTIASQRVIIIFKVKGSFNDIEHEEYKLILNSEPIDIFLDENTTLWTISSGDHSQLEAFYWKNNSFLKAEKGALSNVTIKINQVLNEVGDINSKKDLIPLLFKKSFDNVKDYMKRKNERLTDQCDKKAKVDPSNPC